MASSCMSKTSLLLAVVQLGCVLGLWLCLVVVGVCTLPAQPRRCCSHDQWEADVTSLGTTTRIRNTNNSLSAKLSYDYRNRRWAFEYKDRDDPSQYRKLVYHHKAKSKFLVVPGACYNITLNAPMARYCVPRNATYHGYYEHIGNGVTLGYDVWSFEVFMYPIRMLQRVSRDRCLPLQESAFGLIQNTWRWYDGEPICVPWRYPTEAANGECFRSHIKRTIDYIGTKPTAHLLNMEFRNVNLTITNKNLFKVPSKCKVVDDWPKNLKWNEFWRLLIIRMKEDEPNVDF